MSSVSPSQSASNASFRVADDVLVQREKIFQELMTMTKEPPSWALASASALNSYMSTLQKAYTGFVGLSGSDGSQLSSSVASAGGLSEESSTPSFTRSCSSRSSRARRRNAKAYVRGKCYLKLVEPRYRVCALDRCGEYPTLKEFLSLPSEYLLSRGRLELMRVSFDSGIVHVSVDGALLATEVLASAASKVRMGLGSVQAAVSSWGLPSAVVGVTPAVRIGGTRRQWVPRVCSGTEVVLEFPGLAVDVERVDSASVENLIIALPSAFCGLVIESDRLVVSAERQLSDGVSLRSIDVAMHKVGFTFSGRTSGGRVFRYRTLGPRCGVASVFGGVAAGGSVEGCDSHDFTVPVGVRALSVVRVLADKVGASLVWQGRSGVVVRVPEQTYVFCGHGETNVGAGDALTLQVGASFQLFLFPDDRDDVREVTLVILSPESVR